MPDDYHLLFLLRLISSWIFPIFRLSENSGSYYRHIYLYDMNRTRSANTDRDINLSERKMVLWTIQYNWGKINVGTWLFCFCLISCCSDVCCWSLKAVADRQLNKYEASFNKKIHQHGEDNTSAQLKGEHQIPTLPSSLLQEYSLSLILWENGSCCILRDLATYWC